MATQVFDLIENFSEENVINLIRDVEKIFDSEDNLVHISEGKTMIIGDLHGDFNTLQKIIEKLHNENFQTLIFLGDYVDRGAKQVEVINALFYYKKLMPDRIFLLRGNHEDPIINRQYGFYDEIRLKFSNNREIFRRYNQVFSRLPIAALTWNMIFCVHGGIPQELEDIEEINELPQNQEEINHPITTQLLWNDPKERVKNFKKSLRGPGIKNFGEDAFFEFIERNQIKYIIRSHEKFKNGYKKYFGDKLISIFSSQSYSKRVSTVIGVIDRSGKIEVVPI
jgi:diadenosine tetraphosphatase ApaH/serine/threonine PP2A family protein phosphatase